MDWPANVPGAPPGSRAPVLHASRTFPILLLAARLGTGAQSAWPPRILTRRSPTPSPPARLGPALLRRPRSPRTQYQDHFVITGTWHSSPRASSSSNHFESPRPPEAPYGPAPGAGRWHRISSRPSLSGGCTPSCRRWRCADRGRGAGTNLAPPRAFLRAVPRRPACPARPGAAPPYCASDKQYRLPPAAAVCRRPKPGTPDPPVQARRRRGRGRHLRLHHRHRHVAHL